MQEDEKWRICVNREHYLEVNPNTQISCLYLRGIVSSNDLLLCAVEGVPISTIGHYTFREIYPAYYGGTVHLQFVKP
jgi:hypothetical protein